MRMENSILICCGPERVFRLASAIEDWPELLPHYRDVTILGPVGSGRLAEMKAFRGRIPVRWRAIQTTDSSIPTVRFHHVAGFTRGMDVAWRFTPEESPGERPLTRASITHELTFGTRAWLLARIIGPLFIDPIATRTLARIKVLAEASGA